MDYIWVNSNCLSNSAISGLLQAAPESGEDWIDDPLEDPLDEPVGEAPDEEQVVFKIPPIKEVKFQKKIIKNMIWLEFFLLPMALSLFSLFSSVLMILVEVFKLVNLRLILITSILLSLKGILLDFGVELDSTLNGLTVGVSGKRALVHWSEK